MPGRWWPGCWMSSRGSCGHSGSRRAPKRSWAGLGRCPARSRWPMRLARPGSGWPGGWGSSGCGVWWWPRPSWSARPGDRVKTDRRDAERLARLLHIGELPGVRVPTVAEEAARDLVRAREDARADLMRARHRLSKLLLGYGLVFAGAAWTQAHGRWLVSIGRELDQPGLWVAFDEAHGAVLAVQARRDRLDAAIGELAATPAWAPVVARLGCLRGIGVLTAFGLAVEIGDWQRFTGATIGPGWAWCPASSPAAAGAAKGRSPRPATATLAGCWSRRPGTTANPIGPASSSEPATPASPPRSENAPTAATNDSTSAGAGWMLEPSAPPSAWSRSPASWPDGAGASPSWRPDRPRAGRWGGTSARATRDTPMSSQAAAPALVTLDL